MYLEDLPILALELIVNYLDYSGSKALMETNSFFKNLVMDKVITELELPTTVNFNNFNFKKPVLKLTAKLSFQPLDVHQMNNTISTFARDLDRYNLSITGDLKIVLETKGNEMWPDVSRVYYHLMLIMILESKLQLIRKLEIELDFLCDKCKSFLKKLPDLTIFSTLETLIVNCINYNDTPTVGLYIYFIKMMFTLSNLKYLTIANIPISLFDEIFVWFLPENQYFSQIRRFAVSKKSKFNYCLFFELDKIV